MIPASVASSRGLNHGIIAAYIDTIVGWEAIVLRAAVESEVVRCGNPLYTPGNVGALDENCYA